MIPPLDQPFIARDLLHRAATARRHRHQLFRSQLPAAEAGQARHLDYTNSQVLRRIVAEHGWPTPTLVGGAAVFAAWEIALHADPMADFQRLALKLLVGAVERGEATAQQWAHLHDRCAVNAGDRQLYGTQYRMGQGGPEPAPVQDPEQLDLRRATVGLPPYAQARSTLRRRLGWAPQTEPAPGHGLPDLVAELAGVTA
ncbi:DUF6624 domain-containing protein [Streptomyces jumonjinensis]|uniref:Uncharacterized protein n=1 Tax=Streptomyces jumonjinensis TaxID=1945 RepID=A0A646KS02_STRJU|nr:DUF6624 domain-containing protein [Streptomyces jumonjinensis]MQT04817.1 hypothetical protein [Streptomyces jumonjinensis]